MNARLIKTTEKQSDIEPHIVFNCDVENKEIMRLDKDGMIYKGQRIEDGGEAHRAFLDVMRLMDGQMK